MKKLIALAIAIIMIAALAVPTFAQVTETAGTAKIYFEAENENVDGPGEDPQNPVVGTTTVSYTVAETFTVVIPDLITVNAVSGEKLSVETNFNTDKTLRVTVRSANEFKLNGDEALLYELNVDGSKVEQNGTVITTSEAQSDAEVTITANFASGITPPSAAGRYEDTLTFTVSVQ